MKTTVAFFYGDVREEHKNLQTYKVTFSTLGMYQSHGYAVEEKGLSFAENFAELQRRRFDEDEGLMRIDIHEPGVNPVILLR